MRCVMIQFFFPMPSSVPFPNVIRASLNQMFFRNDSTIQATMEASIFDWLAVGTITAIRLIWKFLAVADACILATLADEVFRLVAKTRRRVFSANDVTRLLDHIKTGLIPSLKNLDGNTFVVLVLDDVAN